MRTITYDGPSPQINGIVVFFVISLKKLSKCRSINVIKPINVDFMFDAAIEKKKKSKLKNNDRLNLRNS